MRKFTKYPSSYVKASTNYKELSGEEFDRLVDSYNGERSWSLIVAELKGTYGLDTAKKVADAVVEGSSCIKASSYEGEPHWHAIAEFSDGTTLEFDKPYNANGNYSLENEEQYGVESELLTKASDTGKEVTFYSVDFIEE